MLNRKVMMDNYFISWIYMKDVIQILLYKNSFYPESKVMLGKK